MRSNVPLHARKACPQGEPVLRWCGVTTRSARAGVAPEAGETSGRRPRIRGGSQEGNRTNSRDGAARDPTPRRRRTCIQTTTYVTNRLTSS